MIEPLGPADFVVVQRLATWRQAENYDAYVALVAQTTAAAFYAIVAKAPSPPDGHHYVPVVTIRPAQTHAGDELVVRGVLQPIGASLPSWKEQGG